jgi:hypothetical protein
MILADQRISAREIADTLEISWECVGFTTHDVLNIRKLSAKWVPKCLKVDQKVILGILQMEHSKLLELTCDNG